MENNKFRILSDEEEEKNKKLEEDKVDNKKSSTKKGSSTTLKAKLPEWSIEPPLEIKRG